METVNSRISRTWLKLMMDVVVLIMKPAVELTYNLEGKGPTSLIPSDLLERIRVAYEVHIEEFKFQAIDEYISNLDDDNAEMSREWVRGKAKGIIVPLTHSSTFSHAFMSCLQKIIRFTSV